MRNSEAFIASVVAVIKASVDPLAGRVKALEARSVLELPPPVNLTPIETRLAALETKPAPVIEVPDVAPLESRLAALEAQPAPIVPDVAPLDARVKALETAPDLTSKFIQALHSKAVQAGFRT